MRAVVALVLCFAVTACFPGNKRNQRYAKISEGGLLAAGIVILAVSNTGADCDMEVGLGHPKSDCKQSAGLVSGIGLALIIGGLVGFAATVTTAGDDDKPATTTNTPATTPTTTPATTPTTTTPTITPTPATPAAASLMQLPPY